MHGITWTMADYPDPFIRENGDSPDEKAVYDLGRFSGAPHTLDIRYNKNGVFRWCDEERDYSANSSCRKRREKIRRTRSI